MATEKNTGAGDLHVERADEAVSHYKDVDIHDKALNNNALEATVQEHSVGVWQGLKTYKRAAFWSMREWLLRRALNRVVETNMGFRSYLYEYYHGRLRRDPHRLFLWLS